MSKRWAGGSTTAWRKVRAQVLQRDGYRCKLKLPGVCKGIADQVHHTRARELHGDDPHYLVSSCGACNRRAGAPDKHDPKPTPTRWWE